ncbi:MAG TPA: translation initiation factor IF-2 [Firmicutes bacterium]|nr:translation initiation factor IF-2 [Bacillota bacterium]
MPAMPKEQQSKSFGNKNKTPEKSDSKKQMSAKTLLKKGYINQGNVNDYDEEFVTRKLRVKKQEVKKEAVKIEKAVVNTQDVQIKVLSEKIGVPATEIIKQLFKEGIVKTINDSIDFDYAAYIASNFGVELTQELDKSFEEVMQSIVENDDGTLADDQKRPPIVTVLGHVDHGKTSLLDVIRKTSVTAGEAGGITQHIGAYTVEAKGQPITFIDTPGHAAFTAMRARGAQVTDVAILVVAADDGVMPQTVEALNHAKAAEVPIIVAMNKMDKPEANPDRIKQQLTEHGILPEEWGGDSIFVPVSAKTGEGIDKLLEAVLLVAEIRDLKANPAKRARGTIIEAKLDKGRGPVATVLVQNGTLHVGDNVVAGTAVGKIRAMFNDKNKSVKSAGPSMPVEVLGFSEVPNAGDLLNAIDEKLAKQVADERKEKERSEKFKSSAKVSLDDIFGKISEGQFKTLNLIIKADVQGSLEAIKGTVEKISNEEVKIHAIHGGVGAINETDVMLAKASGAIVIGFNVRADAVARAAAEREQVDIRIYNIIYDMVDDITAAIKGMLAPKYRDTVVGQVEVREVFKISGVGTVAGCYVTSGKIGRNCKVRIFRDNVGIYDGEILALKRFKDDVKEVAQGFECGVSIQNYNDIKVGDVFEAYLVEEVKQ